MREVAECGGDEHRADLVGGTIRSLVLDMLSSRGLLDIQR